MALEDFEKELAAEKEAEQRKERHKERHSRKDKDDRHKHHHHRSHREHEHDRDEHRSKRRRRDSDTRGDRDSHKHRRRRSSAADDATNTTTTSRPAPVKRDSWMEAPSAIEVDYVQRKRKDPSPPKQGSLGQDFEMKIHQKELNHHLRDLQNGKALEELENDKDEHEVDYTFGDSGSSWRMTKLQGVYRQAKESGRKVEDVALERFGNLREFDDAREEEIELDRRDTYGKDYVGKLKPSGELYQERKLDAGVTRHNKAAQSDDDLDDEFDNIASNIAVPAPAAAALPRTDQTSINKLKAQLMKAELRKDPKAAQIREEYEAAVTATSSADPTVVQISAMDNRMLSSAPRNEVKSVTNRRGRERGNVQENEEMTIEDMVAEERRTKAEAGGESRRLAERIAKDAKFTNDLEYIDENANKLASRVHKSDLNLRNIAINQYQKINSVLENCPLCHHEDAADPTPTAPIVSLATRTYLTLPTKPELAPYSAMIIPLQHHTNLLHCDDDEWEETRNFMKSLTRFYHSRDSDVLFYENAAFPNRHPHAALVAIPLPAGSLDTAPAFFKEAFLSTESEWSQHKKIIDTLVNSKKGGMGRSAFRKTLAKEMPYFHVWFEMDGGLGHVVEEPERWPKGDLFGREVIGGILGLENEMLKRQGRWSRGGDRDRVEAFRKRWNKYDWTRILVEGGA